jgi:predicted dehydrogenase
MLTFGFIGCGQAARHHAAAVQALGHRIGAVAARPNSPRLAAFARDHHAPQTFDDWRAMLQDAALDAVIVATSWDQTERLAAGVIRSRVPALIEKPLALSLQMAEELLAESRTAAAPVMVGYNRRFYDFIPRLKQLVATRSLVSIELRCPDALRPELARHGQALREHALIYKTSHWLDLLMDVAGPVEVVAMFRSDEPLAYHGLLETCHGVPVHLQAHFDAPAQMALTFNFDTFVCQLQPAEVLRIYEGMDCAQAGDGASGRRDVPRLTEEQWTDATLKPGFVNQLRHFIEAFVEPRDGLRGGCTVEEAVRVTKLCESIKREARAMAHTAGRI